MFALQLPLTVKPHTTFSNPCNKVRGKYFIKKSSYVFIIASVCIQHIHVYFCMNQQMTILQKKKSEKYLDLGRKLKKLSNMKVTMIPIIIDTHATVPKDLLRGLEELEIRGRAEITQTTVLLRSARILRRILETKRHLLLLRLQ